MFTFIKSKNRSNFAPVFLLRKFSFLFRTFQYGHFVVQGERNEIIPGT